MNCEICGEGQSIHYCDPDGGNNIPLFYIHCMFCKCDYATHIEVALNKKHFDIVRMETALAAGLVDMPEGLTREEKRQFILENQGD